MTAASRPPVRDPLALASTTAPAGRAVRSGQQVRLAVDGLASGGATYRVWLYDTIIGARPLAVLHGPSARATLRLPADTRGFRFVDVSRQPPGAHGHSGRSILRVPLSALRPGTPVALRAPGI